MEGGGNGALLCETIGKEPPSFGGARNFPPNRSVTADLFRDKDDRVL